MAKTKTGLRVYRRVCRISMSKLALVSTIRVIVGILCAFLAIILTVEVKTTRTYTTNFAWTNTNTNTGGGGVECTTANATASHAESNTPFPVNLETDDEENISYQRSLARPRPRNLHLVFLGDSVTRYQYLSLAYFLRWGRWFDPRQTQNHLVDAHSFQHPYHPDQDWNEFFYQSNRLLWPLESCDCQRSAMHQALERRYFYDADRNNTLTYINLNGKLTHNPDGGFAGRLNASDVFGNFQDHVGLPAGLLARNHPNASATSTASYAWEYPTWGKVVSEHVAALEPRPEYAVLNAGLHAHNFGNASVQAELQQALQGAHIKSLWKTTSFRKSQLPNPVARTTDTDMCRVLGECFNVSWTSRLQPDLYFDDLHYREPVYRILNEDLLIQLQKLPANYQPLDRAQILLQS